MCVWVYYDTLQYVPLICFSIIMPIIVNISPPNFFILFKVILVLLGLLNFQMNFKISLRISTKKKKKGQRDFYQNCINLQLNHGRTDIFTILSALIQEHNISPHLFSSYLISLSNVHNFQCTDLTHLLSDLSSNVSFFWYYCKCLYFLNFNSHLLVIDIQKLN